MEKEKKRLIRMLQENKISEKEYQLLSSALAKKSLLDNSVLSVLVNPFNKIAGITALLGGLFILAAMSMIGVHAGVVFPGILDIINVKALAMSQEPSIMLLMTQNVISWLVLSVLFIVAAVCLKQQRMRFIDFFGTVALSRYPYLVLTAFIAMLQALEPSLLDIDLSQGLSLEFSPAKILFGMVVIVCIIWQIMTYFFALKESSGLMGKKLWVSFIAALIAGEALSMALITRFL